MHPVASQVKAILGKSRQVKASGPRNVIFGNPVARQVQASGLTIGKPDNPGAYLKTQVRAP